MTKTTISLCEKIHVKHNFFRYKVTQKKRIYLFINRNIYAEHVQNLIQIQKLTTQQQHRTIRKPQIAPAVPTTHVKRINNMTPNIF